MNRGTCLLCFAVNVKIYNNKESHLQCVFEESTGSKVEPVTLPRSLCHICHEKLQQSYSLVTQTRNTWMRFGNVQAQYPPLVQLSTVKILNTPILCHSVTSVHGPDVDEDSSQTTLEALTVDIAIADDQEKCEVNVVKEGRNEHETTSANEEIYSYDVCDMKFSQTRIKQYSCDICKRKFNDKGNLNKHKVTHTGAKPYSCDNCNMKFSRTCALNRHKLTHTGAKPYSCDNCNKKFSRTCALNRHKLTHTGVKPYCCNICKKNFTRRGHLDRHKSIHTGLVTSCLVLVCDSE